MQCPKAFRVGLNRRSFDRRTLLDASGMVNERRKSVQKATASSVPVDLQERSPLTLSVDAVSTLSLGPFFRPFQAFGLAWIRR